MPKLIFEKHFMRLANKLTKNSPEKDQRLKSVLSLLQNDPFTPSLKTHKLKGNLEGLYACSLTHDLRIVFELSTDTIHLIDIGSHDEVY